MPNSQSAPQETETSPFFVSAITISLASDSKKTIESIKLRSKNKDVSLKDIKKTMHANDTHLEKFDPPCSLDFDDHVVVSIEYNSKYSRKPRVVCIKINLRDTAREEQGIWSYRKKERKIEVVVAGNYRLPTLLGTITGFTEACSQFRLLIIGNSGVGKSTLIRKVFGVADVHVSENRRGIADIDREFISPTNDRFVVHDSLGFEAADQENMKLVKEFVEKRKAMHLLKDQLHVVWLCLEIPFCGGRLLEAGVEKFLQRRNEILGKVPLVVVLTKVDQLNTQLELDRSELPPDECVSLKDYKSKHMKEHLFDPLRKAAGKDITYITVSTEDGYPESLPDLMKVTDEIMEKYQVEEAARVAAVIAQRVSIKGKIDASIAIGKKKYWNILLKSVVFRGHTLRECLEVIRDDIITIWNLNDPHQLLMDEKIIEFLLTDLEDASDANEQSNSTHSLADPITLFVELVTKVSSGEPTLSTLATAANMLASVAKITYELFQDAKIDVKIVMAYIVNLICVMQVVFLVASGRHLTEETVSLVLRAYGESKQRSVHRAVREFDAKLGVLPGGRGHVLDKVEELIWHHSIPDHEVQGLRKKVLKIMPSGSA